VLHDESGPCLSCSSGEAQHWRCDFSNKLTDVDAIADLALGGSGASLPLPSGFFRSRLPHRDARATRPHRARLLPWIEARHRHRRDMHRPLPPSTSPSTPSGSRSLHGSPYPRALPRMTRPTKDVCSHTDEWLCLLGGRGVQGSGACSRQPTTNQVL
jgi:hypothetical protein